MYLRVISLAFLTSALLLVGCGNNNEATGESVAATAPPPQPEPYVVDLRAVGMTFAGPSEIPAGWTTFRFSNASGMTHFAIIDVPPEGIDAREMNDTVMTPFQDAMDGMNAGDEEAVNAAFARFPAWIADLTRAGGPGMVSAGLTGETTVYLAPGHYVIECYVKADGVFHSTSPGEGELGMVMDLTVTNDENGAPEPTPTATLAVRNTGFEWIGGGPVAGTNTVRVNFEEQQALPSFVGNDVHVIRVSDPDTINQTSDWMDWRTPGGLQDPAPAQFLGGINDLPAGAHGYFTVDLEPGDYALIAEMPDPLASGFVLPFSIK